MIAARDEVAGEHRNPLNINVRNYKKSFDELPKIAKGPNTSSVRYYNEAGYHANSFQTVFMYLERMKFCKDVALWTNLAAYKYYKKNKKRIKGWKNINKWHVLLWLDISVLIQWFNFADSSKLWSKDFEYVWVTSLMSHNFYVLLTNNIIFRDPRLDEANEEAGGPKNDHSYKITSIIEKFEEAAQHFVYWSQRVAFDEQTHKNKCRSQLRQKNRHKPSEFGPKTHNTANKWGYTYSIILECKETTKKLKEYEKIDTRKGAQLVMLNVDKNNINNSNKHNHTKTTIVTDNYYTHLDCQQHLLQTKGIYCNGVARKNAKNVPKSARKKQGKKLQKGEKTLSRLTDNTTFVACMHDSKEFINISTTLDDPTTLVPTRRYALEVEKDEQKLKIYLQKQEEKYHAMLKYQLWAECQKRGISISFRERRVVNLIHCLLEDDEKKHRIKGTETRRNLEMKSKNANNNSNDNSSSSKNSANEEFLNLKGEIEEKSRDWDGNDKRMIPKVRSSV